MEDKKILKPQKPISNGKDYIYPLTAADQVIRSDGSKLEIDGAISADLLNNKSSSFYVSKEELNNHSPFSFGIDNDGNYGYIKKNTNTVIPFKVGHDLENYKITTISTSVSVDNCIVGKTYMILYAPWSSYGYSTAQQYLSVSSCSGCETPVLLYSTNDGHHSVVGMYKTKATSNTFTVNFHAGGGGYIYVFE